MHDFIGGILATIIMFLGLLLILVILMPIYFVAKHWNDPQIIQPTIAECQTVKISAKAPDGTVLYSWKPYCGADTVYFSKAGTQYTEAVHHAKHTEKIQHQVPNQ